VLIFILVINLLGSIISQDLSDCLRQLRESNVIFTKCTNDYKVILWSKLSHLKYIEDCPYSRLELECNNGLNTNCLLSKLLLAECQLKNREDESGAYELYLDALKLSKYLDNSILETEITKKIIEYLLFTNNDSQLQQQYISIHQKIAYDEYEKLRNQYYLFRFNMEYDYTHGTRTNNFDYNWELNISDCIESGFKYLEEDYRSLYGIYLSINDQHEKAIDQYKKTITLAKNFNADEFSEVEFRSLSNICEILIDQNRYEESIVILNEITRSKILKRRSKNKAIIYDWLAHAHSRIGNMDSAYVFLKKSNNVAQLVKRESYSKKVKELEEKYQNEQLSTDLLEQELSNNKIRTSAIGLGSLASLLAAGWFLYRQRARSQLETKEKQSQLDAINARLDGEQEERKRVANALHDDISSHLSAASIHLSLLDAKNSTSAIKAQELISEASQRTRQLSHELYPPILLNSGLISAISAYADSASSNQTKLIVDTKEEKINLPQELESKIYYIVIEFLQNILKHSGGSQGVVTIDLHGDLLSINLSDDGSGFDVDSTTDSLGISSARARIEDMGGRLIITSSAGQGSKVSFDVPIGVVS